VSAQKKPYHDTKVSILKSRSDIGALLEKWGVESVQWTTHGPNTALRFQFDFDEQTYTARLMVDPVEMGQPYKHNNRGKGKLEERRKKHVDQESRRLHRTLHWYVKSKLEAIDAGLETPTQAWLAAIEGPRGHTIYQEIQTKLPSLKAGDFSTMLALGPAKGE